MTVWSGLVWFGLGLLGLGTLFLLSKETGSGWSRLQNRSRAGRLKNVKVEGETKRPELKSETETETEARAQVEAVKSAQARSRSGRGRSGYCLFAGLHKRVGSVVGLGFSSPGVGEPFESLENLGRMYLFW